MSVADAVARAFHAFVHPGVGALAGVAIDDAQEEKLLRYLELLAKWNRVYNLTAVTAPAEMLTHHLLDSLAILPLLDGVASAPATPAVLDVGSGAGLPGIPIAIARPDWAITLIDSNGKKTAFIQQAAAELALANARVLTGRVEECRAGPFDVIVSRAFASLRDFVGLTRPLLAPGGVWAAMKGLVPTDEIAVLPSDIRCRDTIPLDVPGLNAARHLLLLEVKPA